MGVWTFNTTIAFQFQTSADLRDPTWQPNLRLTDHAILGTDRTQRSIHGAAWTLTGVIVLIDDDQPSQQTAATAATALWSAYRNGTVATLSDSATTWQARVDSLRLDSWGQGAGYIGTITFGRPQG